MALFINRWTRPLHIFVAERGEAVDLYEEPAEYELSGAAHTPALCGIDPDAANSQDDRYRDEPHVLLVTRLNRFSDLEALCESADLCPECRAALPNEWPPAREYIGPGESEDNTEDDSESPTLSELYLTADALCGASFPGAETEPIETVAPDLERIDEWKSAQGESDGRASGFLSGYVEPIPKHPACPNSTTPGYDSLQVRPYRSEACGTCSVGRGPRHTSPRRLQRRSYTGPLFRVAPGHTGSVQYALARVKG